MECKDVDCGQCPKCLQYINRETCPKAQDDKKDEVEE